MKTDMGVSMSTINGEELVCERNHIFCAQMCGHIRGCLQTGRKVPQGWKIKDYHKHLQRRVVG